MANAPSKIRVLRLVLIEGRHYSVLQRVERRPRECLAVYEADQGPVDAETVEMIRMKTYERKEQR